MRRRHQRQVKHSLSLRESQGKSLPDVSVVQRYAINPLVHRLGEIVEGSQLVGVVQVEVSVLGHLVAELTHRVALGVAHVHQLAVATVGIDKGLGSVPDVGEVAHVAPAIVDGAWTVEQVVKQSSLSWLPAIHVVQAHPSRGRAVGFRELLVEALNPI